jgi:protein TonB
MPHPAYTDDARAASIAGKVRVQLTIDPAGQVSVASVLEGLGHGLDEAAVAALRQASFNPATKCGKPVASTFVVAVRFAL